MSRKVLVFDIETCSADLMWSLPPEEMFRLGGFKYLGSNQVFLTDDLEEMRWRILDADGLIGHNIISFDLPVVFGVKSDIPLDLAEADKVFDSWTFATLVHPAPFKYVNRFGDIAFADSPDRAKKWFKLDEQANQLGVTRKTMDLADLAKEFGDPELKGKERERDGYGKIPLGDKRYRKYLEGDVLTSEEVSTGLLEKGEFDSYARREMKIETRKQIISGNGIRIIKEKAEARRDELAARREVILAGIAEKYELPEEGPSPWDTTEGKTVILAALADVGITPEAREDWPRTDSWSAKNEAAKKKEVKAKIEVLQEKVRNWKAEVAAGELPTRSLNARERWIASAMEEIEAKKANPLPPSYGYSLSGDSLIMLTKGTEAEPLGRALAELKGQRSLAQLALDSMHPDGFAHPNIDMLQKSARWSTTKPGLTIWTTHGEGAVEKDYFGADTEDEVLLEFDYSNADSRISCGYSGDTVYAERFEPGADGHLINAIAAWGYDVVMFDEETKAFYRQKAKPLGHGWTYGGQAKTLSEHAGCSFDEADTFCKGMASMFRVLVGWQDSARQAARRQGYVMSAWGRKLWVDKGREFTQAPAQLGQNGTREIVCDAILRFPRPVLRRIKAQIHDALLVSVPRSNWEEWRDAILGLMECSFDPQEKARESGAYGIRGGMRIEFPVGCGPAGNTWYEAQH